MGHYFLDIQYAMQPDSFFPGDTWYNRWRVKVNYRNKLAFQQEQNVHTFFSLNISAAGLSEPVSLLDQRQN